VPTTTEAREKVRELSTKSLEVFSDGKLTTAEKKTQMDAYAADIKKWTEELADLEHVDGLRKQLNAAAGATSGNEHAPDERAVGKSIGEQFTSSAGFKNATKGSRYSTGSIELTQPGVGAKATFTEAGGAAGLIVPTYLTQAVEILFRRLVMADLYPGGSISGNTLIYPKESAVTNAATAVAEGGAKPASDLNIVQVTEKLTKVANTLKVSDETLEDIPATQAYINGRLTLFVKLGEEDELLNGSGTAPHMTGLLNRSGLQTPVVQGAGTNPLPDYIYNMITQIRTNAFVEPDAIVIHPTDWQTIRLSKDSNNQYYGGGPFTAAYGNAGPVNPGEQLWGMRVVQTPAIAAKTVLVGSFGMCAQLFRKGGITVEATNSNEDDFLHNLVAIRAEERLLQAVYRPGGFGKVTLT
jgi:HK97 family phage major capsid protein